MFINLFLLGFLVFTLLLLTTVLVNIISGAPFVPSNSKTAGRMLEQAKLKKGMVIYDLGCGDARLLIQAEKKYGTRGIGYENAPIAFILAWLNRWIHRSHVELRFGNFFNASLKNADVIFLYLGPDVQKKLVPKLLQECRPGTLIVSNTFHLPEFTPFKKIPRDVKKGIKNTIYFYKIKRTKK